MYFYIIYDMYVYVYVHIITPTRRLHVYTHTIDTRASGRIDEWSVERVRVKSERVRRGSEPEPSCMGIRDEEPLNGA